MSKVRKTILEALQKNASIDELLILTNEQAFGEKLVAILDCSCSLLEVPLGQPVAEQLMILSAISKASHVVELYNPDLESSLYLKELRKVIYVMGKYVLSLWNWDERYFVDAFWGDLEYESIAQSAKSLIKRMEVVNKIRVTSDQGTDISFSVAGRSWISADGYCDIGKLAQLPDGEIFTCPVEKTFGGTIVVDGTVSRLWLPGELLELQFNKGVLVSGSSSFVNLLDRSAGGVRTIGEFAIGLNPSITRPYQNISTDEKEGGSVHFAIGDSYHLGETISPYHVDFIVRKPTIYVDGQVLNNYLPIIK